VPARFAGRPPVAQTLEDRRSGALMPTVNFVNEKKQIEVPAGSNLRKEALKAGVKLYGGLNGFGAKVNEIVNCHGLGHCGTCRVKITKGMENASPMSVCEKFTFKYNPLGPAIFAFIGNEDTMRLACCTKVNGDMTVETTPPMNLTGENFFS
jgi:ferredoxin